MNSSPITAYENKELTKQYDQLIRKIDDTRRSRFHMAKRLREEHEWRNKLLLFYNIIIIVLSIITLYQYFVDYVPMASYIILAFSISLSLYSTHLGGVSRLEIAGVMNQNANALSSILSSVQFARNELYTTQEHLEKIREFSDRYESTINNVENHAEIDYFYVKLKPGTSSSFKSSVHTTDVIQYELNAATSHSPQTAEAAQKAYAEKKAAWEAFQQKMQVAITKYERDERWKRILGYAGGSILAILIVLYPTFSSLFSTLFPK